MPPPEKLHKALANQREATRTGGYYGIIIGEVRRGGRYASYQAHVIARMPRDDEGSIKPLFFNAQQLGVFVFPQGAVEESTWRCPAR